MAKSDSGNQRVTVALIPMMVTYTFRTTAGVLAVIFDTDRHSYAIVDTNARVIASETPLPPGTQKAKIFDFDFAQRLIQAFLDQQGITEAIKDKIIN